MPFHNEEYELQENTIERRKNAAKIMEILKFIPKTDTQFFNSNVPKLHEQLSSDDNEDNTIQIDDGSSTNCEEDDDDDFNNLLKNKRMSKIDTDIFLLPNFTAKHQNIEQELRKKMTNNGTIEIPLCAENLEEFTLSNPSIKKNPPKFFTEIHEEMSKIGLDAYLQQKENDELEREKAKNKGGKKKERRSQHQQQQSMSLIRSSGDQQNNNNDNDSMSGIWRMLDGQSVDNGFPITQTGYNVYATDKRLNWLTRKDLSFNERELAKIKCNKWIKKCNL